MNRQSEGEMEQVLVGEQSNPTHCPATGTHMRMLTRMTRNTASKTAHTHTPEHDATVSTLQEEHAPEHDATVSTCVWCGCQVHTVKHEVQAA